MEKIQSAKLAEIHEKLEEIPTREMIEKHASLNNNYMSERFDAMQNLIHSVSDQLRGK